MTSNSMNQFQTPTGWNLNDNKEFKYLDEDTESECSNFDDYISEEPKKIKKKFKNIMSKEEFIPE